MFKNSNTEIYKLKNAVKEIQKQFNPKNMKVDPGWKPYLNTADQGVKVLKTETGITVETLDFNQEILRVSL